MDLNTASKFKVSKMMIGINFDSLPDDIVCQILIRVPAQDIFDATMYVCKKWYDIIKTRDFKYAHLHHSTPGLLIRNVGDREVSYMTMTPDGTIDISKHSYNFNRRFSSSCNGLILETSDGETHHLIITNPVTKQHFTLPPFVAPTGAQSIFVQSAIAYAATAMKYKVIRLDSLDAKNLCIDRCCAILTVGADTSWRLVATQHLSLTSTNLFSSFPFVTPGFVYWTRANSRFILIMDVETEIFTQIQIPSPRAVLHYHFSVGSFLSVLIALDNFKWDVWEMKPQTRDFTKMFRIDLGAQKEALTQFCYKHDRPFHTGEPHALSRFCYKHNCSFKPGECLLKYKLCPVGWLKYREVMIFIFYKKDGHFVPTQTRFRVAYNVRTQDIHLFEADDNCIPYLVHSNSLLWLDGCQV